MIEPFESYIGRNGNNEIELLSDGERFQLDSDKGIAFASDLLDALKKRHPTMISAVEQKMKHTNKALFSAMKENHRLYFIHMAHTVCSCCFGELDDMPDFDGTCFNMEYPRQCRDFRYCPWNGYAERNKDSFMVICGAKHEFGFTPQERKVALLIQKGITNYDVLADLMCLSYASIHKFIHSLHKKTDTATTSELAKFLQDKRI